MKVLNESSFKIMPWKNGWGNTTELFREDISGAMAFRLSRAVINENGLFSIFQGMKRILVILKGAGCSLKINSELHRVETDTIIQFDGDDNVHATLLEDPVIDFNVFFDPRLYVCTVKWVSQQQIKTSCKSYLYSFSKNELWIVEENQECTVVDKMILVELKKAP